MSVVPIFEVEYILLRIFMLCGPSDRPYCIIRFSYELLEVSRPLSVDGETFLFVWVKAVVR